MCVRTSSRVAGTRKYRRSMTPRYITIHSTQNFSRGADAMRHSEALKNGKLRARKRRGGNRIGYLVWHYTVDEDRAVQHLPTNEQGEHADFDGPGNRYSIGIEMCEHRGNSRSETIERTAKLAAYLMQKHNIPLRKVVPHYHWPRRGLSQPHKNCPHYLLDNGHPGAKWQWFLAKVNQHYQSIGGASPHMMPKPGAPAINSHGQIVSSPPAVSPVKEASYTRPSSRYHTVRKGDTLYALSRRYGTSVSAIQRANGLRNSTIGIGKKLRIPAS
jgi:N-acetylmuramoyl-L-alanine amidase